MTQEQKELLLKDLCARLPYGVKCEVYDRIGVLDEISSYGASVNYNNGEDTTCRIEYVKPYLFPLSSITDEQKYTCPIGVANLETFIKNESWTYLEVTPDSILCFIDWCYKNHFDYRGLIPMGLANDANGLNIY